MKPLAAVASLILIGIGIFVGFRLFAAPNLQPKCTFGLKGSSASVTIIGANAQPACDYYLGTGAVNPLSQEDASPIVCRYTFGNNEFLVHDSASYKFAGDLLCSELQLGRIGPSGYPDL